MAMNGDQLGKNISDKMLAAIPTGITIPDQVKTDMEAQWKIIGNEIVNYITRNASISVEVNGSANLAVQVDPTTGVGTAYGDITATTSSGTIS